LSEKLLPYLFLLFLEKFCKLLETFFPSDCVLYLCRVYQVGSVKADWNCIKTLPDLSGTGFILFLLSIVVCCFPPLLEELTDALLFRVWLQEEQLV
jgi:hypothetical protein